MLQCFSIKAALWGELMGYIYAVVLLVPFSGSMYYTWVLSRLVKSFLNESYEYSRGTFYSANSTRCIID
jgi:hypothetical protein